MSDYIDDNGNTFWYETRGSGEPLLLLHPGGAGVDSSAYGPNLEAFAAQYQVYLIDRRAHGHTADIDGPITFDNMADDMIGFIEKVIGKPVRVLGYSDGAIVGLYIAQKRPDLVERLICTAGVFNVAGWEDGVINSGEEPPQFMADSYAATSPDGKEHYQVVVKKLEDMHKDTPSLQPDDLQKIATRVLVMIGDDDEVRLEHAIEFYRSLPKGELAVVPGTSHGLLPEKPELCNAIILDFFGNDAIETYAPKRRAH